MKPGPSFQMGRASALLGATLIMALGLCGSAAQTLRSGRGRTPVPAPQRRLPKPLSSYSFQDLPLQRGTKEQKLQWEAQVSRIAAGGGSRLDAPAPPSTNAQFYDLTTVDPTRTPPARPPLVGPSTRSREIHPFWSWDQQSIYFASNNIDAIGNYGISLPSANAPFHVYRMTSDGAIIVQITGGGEEASRTQLYPALNHAQTKLAVVDKDSLQAPGQLVVVDLFTGTRQQLTGVPSFGNALNQDLVNIEHPSWSPGDGVIAFSANERSKPAELRNVYTIDIASRVVRRITNRSGASTVEAIDPVFHPSFVQPNRIAFAANARGVTTGGELDVANPTALTDHNLFIANEDGTGVKQITSAPSDDVEPAFNQTLTETGRPRAGSFHAWLAFAARGRQGSATYDIYFYDFPSAEGDDGNPVEGPAVSPIRLFTPDTNAGAVPLDQSTERYPTWSSGLPPQNPIDRIAFQSDRQNNPNDTLRPLPPTNPADPNRDFDIWASEATDITPPTLFTTCESTNETLRILNQPLATADPCEASRGLRIGAPGDTFYFYAKVRDLQYGVESVWLQIKDPDGPSTDTQRQNRKLYGVGSFPSQGLGFSSFNNTYIARYRDPPTPTHFIHLPFETDYTGIGVSDYRPYAGPVRPDAAGFSQARYATFNPGVDDSVRWSGNQLTSINGTAVSNRPPLDSSGGQRWLRLRDDGAFPDVKANDDVYTASWRTPSDASDFYVDLIAYDKAFNPRVPSEQQNWIIYDNIWGFSTQPFISRNPVLVVDDNGAGQKWPRGLRGSFRTFPSFRYGTESDVTERPREFWPQEVRGSGTGDTPVAPFDLKGIPDPGLGSLDGFPTGTNLNAETLDFLIGDAAGYDFASWINTAASLRHYKYDMWRILAKGPLPEPVINDYVPTTDRQPDDVEGKTYTDRPVPRRAVCWSAPYMGDIFLGAGSILDQATQDLLTKYKSRAGRLVVAGGDIGWALTVDGSVRQTFLENVLGADYQGDVRGGGNPNWNDVRQGNTLALHITQDIRRVFTPQGDPPYWGPFYDPDPLGSLTDPPGMRTHGMIPGLGGNSVWTSSTDGTPYEVSDGISPRAGWEEVADGRMVANDDARTTANPTASGSKTVFMAFPLSALGRRYVAETDTAPLDTMNYKAKVSHAMFCWMFSADVVGQIRNLNGGAPIAGAFVQAISNGQTVGTAFSRGDGTYTIRGLPIGGYSIRVQNPGFASFNKATGTSAHGLDQEQLDVLLTPAAPGSISGKVLDKFGQPIQGARVKATLRASPFYTGQRDFFSGPTGPDGRYIIPSVPVSGSLVGGVAQGGYDVVVDQLPPLFSNATPKFTPPVIVLPAQDTPNIDFEVEGQSAALDVSVFLQTPAGTRGAAVAGAEVTLLDSTGQPIAGSPLTTDPAGKVRFPVVPAGPVTISVFKFGLQEGVRSVNIPQTGSVEILLPSAPGQDLFGLVTRALDNQPLTAADNAKVQLALRASQRPLVSDQPVVDPKTVRIGSKDITYNYQFTGAQQGKFTVRFVNDPNDSNPRFFDEQVDVDIAATPPNEAPVLKLRGRDGTLSGTVREDNNGVPGNPVSGATVDIAKKGAPGTIVATATTGSDGKFTTGATKLVSDDLYIVTVRKFGTSTATVNDVYIAGDTDIGNVLVVRAPRGRVFGLVRRSTDQAPRDKVKIEFFTPASSPGGAVKVAETESFLPTKDEGRGAFNYSIGGKLLSSEFLPLGTYEIRVNDPRFRPLTDTVTIAADTANPTQGQEVRKDLNLVPVAGILRGTVKDADTAGTPPIAGARVVIALNGVTQATLVTDENGQFQTASALAPGTYTVTVSSFGFVDISRPVAVEGPTTAPDILLSHFPPSAITGSVVSRLNNQPIDGVTVELIASDGTVLTSATSTGESPSNYRLFPVNAGTFIVRASRPGFKTTQVSVAVSPGTDRPNVNLTLEPDHIFGKGLLLVSLPDEYSSGQDAASLLGQDPGEFKSAYWVTGQNRYAIYPDPEAASFRPGKGMFVRFNAATPFTQAGTPVTDNAEGFFPIPVTAGWNMIGSVRRIRIEWLRVQVQTPDGQVRTMQQAYDARIIQNGLFSYVDGYSRTDFMDPFFGYFVKALQSCTLLIPQSNSAKAAATTAPAGKLAQRPAPSPAQVAKELEAAGLGPAATQVESTEALRSRFYRLPESPLASLLNYSNEHRAWRPGLG